MKKQMMISADTSKMHAFLGKKMYSSKYSWISEICQNAVDSHRMAKVTEPVVLGVRYDEKDRNILYFYVKDVGLSFTNVKDFEAKICTMLDSGKDQVKTKDENCAMGKHGIGSISVCAYQNEWKYTVVCPDGNKFIAILSEDEAMGMNYDITELGMSEEEKSVLFEVEIPLGGLPSLITNMKTKLAYFKDILFEFPEDLIRGNRELLTLNTDFEIFQSEDFQISTFSSDQYMHVCLDQYNYAINWNVLKISPINLNIGLRFTMADGLESDGQRENLQYTDTYSELIIAKIRKVAAWFVNRYNEDFPDEFTSVKDMERHRNSAPCVVVNKVSYPLYKVTPYTSKKPKTPKFKGVLTAIYQDFITKTYGGRWLFTEKYRISMRGNKTAVYNHGIFGSHHILVDQPIPPRTMDYLKANYREASLHYKRDICLLANPKSEALSYQGMFSLDRKEMRKGYMNSGINIWRSIIDQSKILEDCVLRENFLLASSIVVPDNFNKGAAKTRFQRKKINIEDLTGEVNIKYALVWIISQQNTTVSLLVR